jgi:hypothetical protein
LENVLFRFSVTGWVTILAFLALFLAKAYPLLPGFGESVEQYGLTGALVGIAGGPGVGFILNTLVSGWLELWGKGAYRSRAFDVFRNRIVACYKDRRIPPPDRAKAKLSYKGGAVDFVLRAPSRSLVSYFEYDPDDNHRAEFRRRQRTGYFANYASALGICLGAAAGLVVGFAWDTTKANGFVMWLFVLVGALVVAAGCVFIADRSKNQADEQQFVWAIMYDESKLRELVKATCDYDARRRRA